MHVNPALAQKGLMMLFNPTQVPITRTISLPLYYTGLSKTTIIKDAKGVSKIYTLNRDYTIDFTFTIAADSYSWFLIE